jgi:hypothetical protein
MVGWIEVKRGEKCLYEANLGIEILRFAQDDNKT